jgi:hypothetical protein
MASWAGCFHFSFGNKFRKMESRAFILEIGTSPAQYVPRWHLEPGLGRKTNPAGLWPCLFPRPGDAFAGDARHGEASPKSLSAFHRPQYKFRVLLPLCLTEARKTPGVWRDFFVGSLLSIENPIISGPKQALYWL